MNLTVGNPALVTLEDLAICNIVCSRWSDIMDNIFHACYDQIKNETPVHYYGHYMTHLHYSKLADAAQEFADELITAGTPTVITAQSSEIIEALHSAFVLYPDSFAYYRVDRIERLHGQPVEPHFEAVRYTYDMLLAAIECNMEYR